MDKEEKHYVTDRNDNKMSVPEKPKRSCTRCQGRGIYGYDVVTGFALICSCTSRTLKRKKLKEMFSKLWNSG